MGARLRIGRTSRRALGRRAITIAGLGRREPAARGDRPRRLGGDSHRRLKFHVVPVAASSAKSAIRPHRSARGQTTLADTPPSVSSLRVDRPWPSTLRSWNVLKALRSPAPILRSTCVTRSARFASDRFDRPLVVKAESDLRDCLNRPPASRSGARRSLWPPFVETIDGRRSRRHADAAARFAPLYASDSRGWADLLADVEAFDHRRSPRGAGAVAAALDATGEVSNRPSLDGRGRIQGERDRAAEPSVGRASHEIRAAAGLARCFTDVCITCQRPGGQPGPTTAALDLPPRIQTRRRRRFK